jgi:segregation and condensation protein A
METAANPVFSVKTSEFEGPLELLIELVEKRKLLINNISIAEVTDEYMERVRAMQEQSLPHTAQFVALAATLLLIKSKSLLPALDLSSEEEASIDDLEARLRLYQLYRDIGLTIQQTYGKQVMYEPEYQPKREPIFAPDDFCSQDELRNAMERVVASLPVEKEQKPKARVQQTISLDQMMDNLQKRIEKQFSLSFFAIRDEEPEHKNVIVGFLAILELFKQGNVLISQESRFSDIGLELERQDTPRYY